MRSSGTAIRHRNVLDLIAAGGNIYYLAKFAGIFGLNVQDVGAQQTGMSVEDFKAKLGRRAGTKVAFAVGAIGCTHVPAIGGAIAAARRTSPTGGRSSAASPPRASGSARVRPDVAMVIYNDHGLNFFLDNAADLRGRRGRQTIAMRTRAGAFPRSATFRGDAAFSWHIIE